MDSKNFLIVTCDGGGIRGLLTSLLLQELDREFHVLDKAALFAGTSTGGVMALCLASGVAIRDLVGLYENDGTRIFTPYTTPAGADASREYVKYDPSGLKSLLEEFIPTNPTLAELGRNVVVSTFRLFDEERGCWCPLLLHNLPNSETATIHVTDAALCTSAAPLYFPPHHVEPYGYCVDGGVFANNPGLFALTTALSSGVLNRDGKTLDDVRILSIGTGVVPDGVPPDKVGDPFKFGATWWLSPKADPPVPSFPFVASVFDGTAEVDTLHCAQLLGPRYKRTNIRLTTSVPLDDCSQVPLLQRLAEEFMETDEWKSVGDWVAENFV